MNKNISNKILDKATLEFFPEEGNWYSNCFKKSENLSMENLPCNLRNDNWLAIMLELNQSLFYMNTKTILEYVKTSSFFKEKRHEYELRIVEWQIDWMRSGGENWITDEKYGGDFVFLTPVCDLGFRKGVVDTLSNIGINKDAIEEGIEKNAYKWRNLYMSNAFNNEYNPVFRLITFGEDENKFELADPKFKEKWLRVRKYEYYQKHKESVDKYGIVEPDMLLGQEEVERLKDYINKKHIERKEYLNKYQKSNNQKVLKMNFNI